MWHCNRHKNTYYAPSVSGFSTVLLEGYFANSMTLYTNNAWYYFSRDAIISKTAGVALYIILVSATSPRTCLQLFQSLPRGTAEWDTECHLCGYSNLPLLMVSWSCVVHVMEYSGPLLPSYGGQYLSGQLLTKVPVQYPKAPRGWQFRNHSARLICQREISTSLTTADHMNRSYKSDTHTHVSVRLYEMALCVHSFPVCSARKTKMGNGLVCLSLWSIEQVHECDYRTCCSREGVRMCFRSEISIMLL